MSDSNDTRDRKEELVLLMFVIIKYSCYLWSAIIFQSGLGLVVNIYCKF